MKGVHRVDQGGWIVVGAQNVDQARLDRLPCTQVAVMRPSKKQVRRSHDDTQAALAGSLGSLDRDRKLAHRNPRPNDQINLVPTVIVMGSNGEPVTQRRGTHLLRRIPISLTLASLFDSGGGH